MQEILDRLNSLKILLGQLKQQQDQITEDLAKTVSLENSILLEDTVRQIDQIIEYLDTIDTLIQQQIPQDEINYIENDEDTNFFGSEDIELDTFLDYTKPRKKAIC